MYAAIFEGGGTKKSGCFFSTNTLCDAEEAICTIMGIRSQNADTAYMTGHRPLAFLFVLESCYCFAVLFLHE